MTLREWAIPLALACFSLVANGGCAPEEIVAAKRESPPPADGSPGVELTCATSDDCDLRSYCAKKSCAEAVGHCEVRPIACESTQAPVCGCDGISYFNDCLRRARGINPEGAGACEATALPCTNGRCPDDAYCAFLLPATDTCREPSGTCWIIPRCTPEASGADQWTECGGAERCLDTCNAIQTEAPYVRAFRCPPP